MSVYVTNFILAYLVINNIYLFFSIKQIKNDLELYSGSFMKCRNEGESLKDMLIGKQENEIQEMKNILFTLNNK